MPRTKGGSKSESLNITLPAKAVEDLEFLKDDGLYGTSRAAVASFIILKELQRLREIGALER